MSLLVDNGVGGDKSNYYPSLPPSPFSFHLLEFTIISAQDLFPSSRSMTTYAIAWVHPNLKFQTRLDPTGHTDPMWNNKFVFKIKDVVLQSNTSPITIEIYSQSLINDSLLGNTHALLSTLRPTTTLRFAALQVRQPNSLRPQGILNVSITLIDNYARSLPLYQELLPVVGKAKEKAKAKVKAKSKRTRGSIVNQGMKIEEKLKRWRKELPSSSRENVKEKVVEGEGKIWRKGKSFGRLGCFSPTIES